MSAHRHDALQARAAREPKPQEVARRDRLQLAGSELARMLAPAGVTVTSRWELSRGESILFEDGQGNSVELIAVLGDRLPQFDATVHLVRTDG